MLFPRLLLVWIMFAAVSVHTPLCRALFQNTTVNSPCYSSACAAVGSQIYSIAGYSVSGSQAGCSSLTLSPGGESAASLAPLPFYTAIQAPLVVSSPAGSSGTSAAPTTPALSVVGGFIRISSTTQPAPSNTVYITSDLGNTWATVSLSQAGVWSPRYGHQVTQIVTPGGSPRLVLTGGFDGSNYLNTVWITSNLTGATDWLQSPEGPWTARLNHAAVAFNGGTQLILTGGVAASGNPTDVWSGFFTTASSFSWQRQTMAAPFGIRQNPGLLDINNHLYLIAGVTPNDLTAYNDVWVSLDSGRTWLLVTGRAEFSPRFAACIASTGNQAIVYGGLFIGGGVANDVWVASLG